jgi:hypothetical protein
LFLFTKMMVDVVLFLFIQMMVDVVLFLFNTDDKGNNKITELRTILQRESKNS